MPKKRGTNISGTGKALKEYKITPVVWLVRDEDSARYHVENDDYFGTVAAVLSLIKQEIKKDRRKDAAILDKILRNLEEELLFLQENYYIKPKTITKSRNVRQGQKSKTGKARRKASL